MAVYSTVVSKCILLVRVIYIYIYININIYMCVFFNAGVFVGG